MGGVRLGYALMWNNNVCLLHPTRKVGVGRLVEGGISERGFWGSGRGCMNSGLSVVRRGPEVVCGVGYGYVMFGLGDGRRLACFSC